MAELLINVGQAGFLTAMLPTIWNQWRLRRCTITLSTCVVYLSCMSLIIAGLWAAEMWRGVGFGLVSLVSWSIIASQRLRYRR